MATGALRRMTSPAFALLLLGLLVNLYFREEVYANLESGLPLLALFGTVSCIGQLTISIARRSGALAFACCIPAGALRTTIVLGVVPGKTRQLPLLIALLLGPIIVLLAGLGGWV
jgi:hypothetical protein